jgi:hypothetical protein
MLTINATGKASMVHHGCSFENQWIVLQKNSILNHNYVFVDVRRHQQMKSRGSIYRLNTMGNLRIYLYRFYFLEYENSLQKFGQGFLDSVMHGFHYQWLRTHIFKILGPRLIDALAKSCKIKYFTTCICDTARVIIRDSIIR